ncbi:hypothetical protein AAV94_10135 [Lampropedia cohaerens]|uniref:Transporter n=1 Tax=Lampropedia cohaerens TaxID=1610491 RepID=A0A0U1PYG4_9BURK|nr:AEC family transporter [Lampropedia cohaerens]KKW67511.1 hypothetical protein AAV94_10135 [Lampropedia cohaerens]
MLAYVTPVFLIIALGVAVKRMRNTPPTLFPSLEWLTFYVAFPALLFLRTAQLQMDAATLKALATLVIGPVLLMLLLALLLLRWGLRALPAPARSSVVQGTTRPSTYFGLAVAGLVFPPEISALVMLALAIAMPPVNVIAVVALAWWSGQRVTARTIARNLARNPIILATLAGTLTNLSGVPLPAFLANALEILGGVALGLGLLCVGGGLVFQLQGAYPLTVILTDALKLLGLPSLTWLLCRWLAVSDDMTIAACFFAALPTAPNAYIMARQLGGDARLMASLITTQTLLSMVTVPLWLMVLGVSR